MREIKFRAWDSVFKMKDVAGIDFKKQVVELLNEQGESFEVNLNRLNLMQSTELFDKNGKEIYEGDILAVMYSCGGIYKKGEVEFSTNYDIGCNGGEYGFNICGYHCQDEYLTDCMIAGEAEIIGNIYDNPELLEDRL